MSESLRQNRVNFLPSGSGDFLRQRLTDAGAICLALIGIGLFLACLTYNPADPSLNRAVESGARNLLGIPGAFVADILIQTLGLAAFFITPVCLAWAWRIFRQRQLPYWGFRLAALPFALLLAALALASLSPPGSWLPETTLGGSAGRLILGHTSNFLDLSAGIVAWAAFPIALMCFVFVLSLSLPEWRAMVSAFVRLGSGAKRGLRDIARQAETVGAKAAAGAREHTSSEPEVELPDRQEPRLKTSVETLAQAPVSESITTTRSTADLVAPRKTRVKPGKQGSQASQGRLDFGSTGDAYETPPLTLMDMPANDGKHASVTKDALEKKRTLAGGRAG